MEILSVGLILFVAVSKGYIAIRGRGRPRMAEGSAGQLSVPEDDEQERTSLPHRGHGA